jgi:CRP/FNR family transcriptional regulator, cyclic AMP receptor protein
VNLESILRNTEIFSQLNGDQIERLSRLVTHKSFAAGARIIRRGDRGVAMYAIVRGRVKLVVPSHKDESEHVAGELGSGDVFGEMSLLDGAPRSTDVVATEPSECLVLSRFDFSSQLEEDPDLAKAIIPFLCLRIRRLQDEVARCHQRVARI